MKIEIPNFGTKKELFKFLVENKSTIVTQKKAMTKFADGFSFMQEYKNVIANKAESNVDVISRKAIINTTNVIDSHDDLHLNGMWDKSLKENKNILYLQEHEMKFSNVIADGKDLKASAKTYSWEELGFDFKGETQALEFDVAIKKDRNPFMFNQFKENKVQQNSVGMRYVKIDLAINDSDYASEFAVWNKYYDVIANKDAANERQYFWAVSEAKVIEGSAVLLGSNSFTPVLDITEPVKTTQETEPDESTPEAKSFIELLQTKKLY